MEAVLLLVALAMFIVLGIATNPRRVEKGIDPAIIGRVLFGVFLVLFIVIMIGSFAR